MVRVTSFPAQTFQLALTEVTPNYITFSLAQVNINMDIKSIRWALTWLEFLLEVDDASKSNILKSNSIPTKLYFDNILT